MAVVIIGFRYLSRTTSYQFLFLESISAHGANSECTRHRDEFVCSSATVVVWVDKYVVIVNLSG